MRIFNEKTGELITNPDLSHGIINRDNNPVTFEYIIDVAEQGHMEVIAEYPNGGKDEKYVVDVEEVGSWHTYETRTGKKVDITSLYEWDHSKCVNKLQIYPAIEAVGLYHTYTAKEQHEYDKMVEEQEAREEQRQAKDKLIDNLPEFEDDTDNAICDLYEIIPAEMLNSNSKHHAICKAYARRILRGEITLDDVPEELRDEVREILEEN